MKLELLKNYERYEKAELMAVVAGLKFELSFHVKV